MDIAGMLQQVTAGRIFEPSLDLYHGMPHHPVRAVAMA